MARMFTLAARENECNKAVVNVTLNGELDVIFPSVNFEERWNGGTYTTMRFPRINRTVANAENTTWCFKLQAPCPELRDLCHYGRCQYALADNNVPSSFSSCCPVQSFNPLRNNTWEGKRRLAQELPARVASRMVREVEQELPAVGVSSGSLSVAARATADIPRGSAASSSSSSRGSVANERGSVLGLSRFERRRRR